MQQQPQLNEHNKEEYPPMHTCEHIVNQTMCRLHHCGRAVSAHIEHKKSKLDFALPAPLTDEQVRQLEDAVNAVIDRHLDVTTSYLPITEAAARFDLGRLPDDVSETVRVVSIGDYDECLCLGRHVANTGEIGHFKVTTWSYADGIFRMRFKLV